jgi:hypothetical protein
MELNFERFIRMEESKYLNRLISFKSKRITKNWNGIQGKKTTCQSSLDTNFALFQRKTCPLQMYITAEAGREQCANI